MANLSATSVASAVVTTVALIASILSLAVDRWGQLKLTILVEESSVRRIFSLITPCRNIREFCQKRKNQNILISVL